MFVRLPTKMLLLENPTYKHEMELKTLVTTGIIENGIGNGLIFIAFHTSILVIPDINIIGS